MFVQESVKRRCSFPGCGRPHLAKGLCRGHYEQQRLKRSLRPLPSRLRDDPACSFEGCGNVAVNRGLCQAYANQRRKGQSLRPLRPFYGREGTCRFEAAPNPVRLEASARPRRPVLRRSPIGSTLQAEGRMRLPSGSRVSDLVDAAVRVLRIYRPELLSASAMDSN
jgi:hypothetical protein